MTKRVLELILSSYQENIKEFNSLRIIMNLFTTTTSPPKSCPQSTKIQQIYSYPNVQNNLHYLRFLIYNHLKAFL